MSGQLMINFEPSASLRRRASKLFTSPKLGTGTSTHSGILGELNYTSFYKTMNNWKLSDSIMRQLSFPQKHPLDPNRAVITEPYHKFFKYISDQSKRKCNNCKRMYNVYNPHRPCRYHWKSYYHHLGVNICCNGPKGAVFCAISPRCVTADVDVNNLKGYKNTSVNGHGGIEVYAIDAEMAYTEYNLEACAVTLVDANCKVVYETYFLPDKPIIDYNTRHSNLTEANFRDVKTKLADVQEQLLRFLGPSSVLVGHSLSSDMLNLKLIHNKVVDTTVLFPPDEGRTRRLQDLKEKYLLEDKSESNYHLKCTGDAIVTMRLVLLKAFLKEKGCSYMMM